MTVVCACCVRPLGHTGSQIPRTSGSPRREANTVVSNKENVSDEWRIQLKRVRAAGACLLYQQKKRRSLLVLTSTEGRRRRRREDAPPHFSGVESVQHQHHHHHKQQPLRQLVNFSPVNLLHICKYFPFPKTRSPRHVPVDVGTAAVYALLPLTNL